MQKIIRKHTLLYVAIVLLSMISAFLLSTFSIKLGAVIDVVVKNEGTFLDKIMATVIVCFLWFLSSMLFTYLKSRYIFKILRDVKQGLYSALNLKELDDFNQRTSDQYLNIFTKNIELIGNNYIAPRCDLVSNLVSAIISVGAIFFINWKLALAFIGVSLVTIVLSQLPGILMAKSLTVFTGKNADYLKVINNYLKGYEQIKLLNIGQLLLKDYVKADEEFEISRRKFIFNTSFASILGMFFSFFAQLACMSIGIYFVLNGELTVGLLISAVNLLNGLFGPIQSFAQDKNLIGTVKEIKEEIDGILSCMSPEGMELSKPVEKIKITDLSMKFSEAKIIFDNYNTEFVRGRTYAIVGESGRGKSTLVKLIMKFFPKEMYTGTIMIDGTNLNEISSDSIYKHIAYIQRSDFFIDGSVLDNILLKRYENAPDGKLFEKLNLSREFLSKKIGDTNNDKISAGEKQRIDIARFLSNDYDVLIFDEPTSNLDAATSELVFNLIFENKDKIVIVITHTSDKDVLARFDEVIRL